MLVAVVIGGLLTTVIFRWIDGQGRYVQVQSAREEVQQNARAALELIGSELRSIPPGTALEMATDDSLRIRVPRFWGTVCNANVLALPAQVTVRMPRLVGANLTFVSGDSTGLVANVANTPGAEDWTGHVNVTGIGSSLNSTPPAGCQLMNPAEPLPVPQPIDIRTLSLSGIPLTLAPDTVRAGDPIYVFDRITYRADTGATVPGRWIQRRVGGADRTNQPLAGPIANGGLRFVYFSGTSTTPLVTPLSAAQRESVDQVMVVVSAVSRNRLNGVNQAETDTLIISLRNR